MVKIISIGLFILIVIVTSSVYLFVYEPEYSGELVSMPEQTLVFAHRGFGLYAPDNSLQGVELAIAANMDGVDVDGQITKDGALIIYHDLSVDRLTASTGRVSEKTLEEMLALDLGPKFDPDITGVYVQTFERLLETMQGHGIFMVELKVPGIGRTGIEELAVSIIQKHDAHEDVVISSFNPLVLYRLKKLDPNVRTALTFMDTNWNEDLLAGIKKKDRVALLRTLQQEWIRRGIRKIIKPDFLSVNFRVEEATIDRLQSHGWPIFIWTPNTEEYISDALFREPFGVISDEPLLTQELRDEFYK